MFSPAGASTEVGRGAWDLVKLCPGWLAADGAKKRVQDLHPFQPLTP